MEKSNMNGESDSDDITQPPYKRGKMDEQQGYYMGSTRGTSFGLNFVTYQEYEALKIEHENLKHELANMRQSIMGDVHKTLFAQIDSMKKENSQLKEEIRQLRTTIASGSSHNAGGERTGNVHIFLSVRFIFWQYTVFY